MKTEAIYFLISVDGVEYGVMFKPYRSVADVEPGLMPWDVVVTKFHVLKRGCSYYFACKYPTIGDARTFLRMSLPVLTEPEPAA